MREPITIIVTTWFPNNDDGRKRLEYARQTVLSWEKYLDYDGKLDIHIADDGSDSSLLEQFLYYCARNWDRGVTIGTKQDRKGVGASLNQGFNQPGELFAYFVDDWALTQNLDLTPWADMLVDEKDVGMVRLGPPHPWLTGKIETKPTGWIMRLDRHHYAYGMRPALYHRRFIDTYGKFPEDCSSMECERLYNLNFCHMQVPGFKSGPDIVIALPFPFEHLAEDVHYSDVQPQLENKVESVTHITSNVQQV